MRCLLLLTAILMLPTAAGAASPCASVKAEVSIGDVSYADGVLKASGTWQVGEGSPGAMVEYRIQSDRQWAESRTGTSGTWEVTLPWSHCDRSVLRVDVFPSLKIGNTLVHCTENGKFATQRFVVSCTPTAEVGPCQWECAEKPEPRCTGTCTGSGKGGAGALAAMHGVNGKDYQTVEGSPQGPWSWTVTCAPGDKVSFLVRDKSGSGVLSAVAELPCGKE